MNNGQNVDSEYDNAVKVRAFVVLSFFVVLLIVIWILKLGFVTQRVEHMNNSTNIIPRALLFGLHDKSAVQVSPDGRFVSYLTPMHNHSKVLNIAVISVQKVEANTADDKGVVDTYITTEEGDHIVNYVWAFDNTHILYAKDTNGDENYHIHSVNINSKKTIDLTPFAGKKAEVIKVSHKHPSFAVIAVNKRTPEFFDLYKVNVETGESSLLLQNHHYSSFVVDDDLHVRFAQRADSSGDFVIDDLSDVAVQNNVTTANNSRVVKNELASVQLMKFKPEEANTTYIIDFSKDGKKLYISDSRNSDTAGLFLYDLVNKSQERIYVNNAVDIGHVLMHPREKIPEVVFYTDDKLHYHILSSGLSSDFDILQPRGVEQELRIVDRDLDNRIWIVSYSSDIHPVEYYLYDRVKKIKKFLFSSNQKLANYKFLPMQVLRIRSRDGIELLSYLTLPSTQTNSDGETTSVPRNYQELPPLLVLVHGGPIWRDVWGFNAIHQWAANRGYAVLSVNYRGSAGFGKHFIRAGFGEWGERMHTDIVDVVQWMINNNVVRKDKIAIFGGSYGGYEALMSLILSPQLFNCAVDIAGPTDLVVLANTIPPHWKPMASLFEKMLGGKVNTKEGDEILLNKSPISHIVKITKPLLIAHGAHDPRVKKIQVDNLVESLQDRNIPVTYLLYPDEGHSFTKEKNRVALFAVIEQFLAQHSNISNIEPLDLELVKRSTMQIKTTGEGWLLHN